MESIEDYPKDPVEKVIPAPPIKAPVPPVLNGETNGEQSEDSQSH